MIYARIDLTAHAVVSTGPLPTALVGLSDASLADLAAAVSPCPPEFDGIGYWPVVADVKPAVADGEEEAVPAADAALVVDPAAAVVRRPWVVQPAPPPPVPTSVEPRQARLALSRAGLLSQAEEALAAMPGQAGEEARIEWQFAKAIRRDHPMIDSLGTTLGLTTAEIDDLFRVAATL